MTMTAMQKLQAAMQAQQEKKQPKKKTGDNASYPFWSIPEGGSATIRFLPDGDPDNAFFWVRKEQITLRFDGQVGGDYPTDEEVELKVPCIDMFGEQCPITAHIRPWWKQGPDKEALARKYYKKKSYLFQGFVVNSPFEEQEVPENPIRRFVVNPSIYTIIEKSLTNPEFEDIPVDYTGGRDFKIAKTRQGEYANYGTSGWSFRVRPLNDAEMTAIDQHSLYNLSDFQGARPDADGVAMIKAMFLDSLAGKPFDFDSYGSLYRAYPKRGGGGGNDGDTSTARAVAAAEAAMMSAKPAPRAQVQAPAPVSDDEETSYQPKASAPKAAPAADGEPAKAPPVADILARIKARTGQG